MNVIETLKQAEATLESLRRGHRDCEDTWYSCPMRPDYGGNMEQGSICECGADEDNAKIDETIEVIRRQIMFLEMDLS